MVQRKMKRLKKMEDLEFTTATSIKEEIFAEDNAFYVEILEENYHHRDQLGFGLSMKKVISFYQ